MPISNPPTPAVKVVSGDLVAGAQQAKIFGWQNNLGVPVLVIEAIVNVTTGSAVLSRIDVGHSVGDATSDDLMDGNAINGVVDVNSHDNQGANGQFHQLCPDGEWITGYEANVGPSTGMVGRYYLAFMPLG